MPIIATVPEPAVPDHTTLLAWLVLHLFVDCALDLWPPQVCGTTDDLDAHELLHKMMTLLLGKWLLIP